jgi:hypothetical protein
MPGPVTLSGPSGDTNPHLLAHLVRRLGMRGDVPFSVPLLGRGQHRDPRTGACLVEFASVLAAAPWSDAPATVDPALAQVARHVNDAMSDAGRRLLVPLAPLLVGTAGADLRVRPALITVCLSAALEHCTLAEHDELLAAYFAALSAVAAPPRTQRRGEGRRAARLLAAAVGIVARSQDATGERDARLCALLLACINQTRRLRGQPFVDPRRPLARCPDQITLCRSWRIEEGCDWLSLSCVFADARDAERWHRAVEAAATTAPVQAAALEPRPSAPIGS